MDKDKCDKNKYKMYSFGRKTGPGYLKLEPRLVLKERKRFFKSQIQNRIRGVAP